MSQQIQLPSVAQARQTIYNNVHVRAFLDKMAELGHPAKTEDEARELLLLAEKAAQYTDEQLPPKTVAVPVKAASKYATVRMAVGEMITPGSTEAESVKQAAYELARDPQNYLAAIVLKQDILAQAGSNQGGSAAAA